jgi:putative flippase GtrA
MLKQGIRFYTVGFGGVVLQLTALAALEKGLGLGYLPATAIAVELAILHNFLWHERWTWADRTRSARGKPGRFLRFHLANGVLSILGNVALMTVLVGRLRLPVIQANVMSIALCSALNFLAADRFVFRAPEPE